MALFAKIINRFAALAQDLAWSVRSAGDWLSRLQLLADFLAMGLIRGAIPNFGGRLRTVTLRGGHRLHYRWNRCDLYAIHEVYVTGEYDLPGLDRPGTFVDLGANVGIASNWVRFRGGRVLAVVEPSDENLDVLRRNVDPATTVFHAVVGAADGEVIFDRGPGATNGRAIQNPEDVEAGAVTVRVPQVGIDTLMSRLPETGPIDLVKIDIEGGERDLFSREPAWLDRCRQVIIELHPQLIDEDHIRRCFQQHGFTPVYDRPVHTNRLVLFKQQGPASHERTRP